MMTPVETLKALSRAMSKFPLEEQQSLKRIYEKTWLMVEMYNDLLMTPTKAGGARLADLLSAVRREGQRRGISYFGTPKPPDGSSDPKSMSNLFQL